MATEKEKTAKTPGTDLAAPGSAQSGAIAPYGKVSLDMLAEDANTTAQDLGIRAQDLAIPFIKVAQKMSNELSPRDAKHIAGVEEGDFFNSVTGEIFKGDKGIIVIPCAFRPSYTEWKPRNTGGGLVKDWGTDDSCMQLADWKEVGQGKKLVMKDGTPGAGNHLVPSYMYYCLLVKDLERGVYDQVVLNLHGTQYKKGRKWNNHILAVRVPAEQSPTRQEMRPKPWYMSYQWVTAPESNNAGEWMGWVVKYHLPTLQLPNGDSLYVSARSFAELVEKGKAKVRMEDFAEEVNTEERTQADPSSKGAF